MTPRLIQLAFPFLALGLAIPVAAQSTPVFPSTLKLTKHYADTDIGIVKGIGAIQFNTAGTVLYFLDMSDSSLKQVNVVRNASRQITGFNSVKTLLVNPSTYWLDGGCSLAPNGTLFMGAYAPFEMIQDIPTNPLAAPYVLDLKNYGIAGSAGGIEWISSPILTAPKLWVSDYSNGILYELPVKVNANKTYTPTGNAIKIASGLPKPGAEGFAMIPALSSIGAFGPGGGMVHASYDDNKVIFHAFDTSAGKPLLDGGNVIFFDMITNLNAPMDVEFDPITGDLFISQWYAGPGDKSALIQFSGTVGPVDGKISRVGLGCPKKNGQRPTIIASDLNILLPFNIRMTKGPPRQNICFLNVGLSYFGGMDLFGIGCRVYANPLVSLAAGPTDNQGNSQVLTVQPAALAGLKGTTLFFQYYSVEVGANALNLVVSDGVVALAK